MVLFHSHRLRRHAHADVPNIHVVVGCLDPERAQQVIFISEADPLSIRAEDMEVRTAAQSAWSKWRSQIARVKAPQFAGPRQINEHTLPMGWSIFPIRRWILRSKNENHLLGNRIKCRDAAVSAIPRFIKNPH